MTDRRTLELAAEMRAVIEADMRAALPDGPATPADLKRVLLASAQSLARPSDVAAPIVERNADDPNRLDVLVPLAWFTPRAE